MLGPKFSKLADYMRGEHNEDDEEEEEDEADNKSESSSDNVDIEKGKKSPFRDLEGGSEV